MVDLDFELDLEKIHVPSLAYEVVRPITDADLGLLDRDREPIIASVKRLSARHHKLARILASGAANWEAAAFTGYSEQNVVILKQSEAFMRLVAHYQAQHDAEYIDLHDEFAGLSQDAARMIRDRMEQDPEKLSINQLVEITKMGADRAGHGPSSNVSHRHEHTIGMADRISAGRKRVAERVIDITPDKDATD